MTQFTRRQFLSRLGAMGMSLVTPKAMYELASGANFDGIIKVIRKGREDLPHVSLTFDDCWREDLTLRIALAFAERGQRVTFFPTGLAVRSNIDRPTRGHENLYRQLHEMGHEFGCHTFTHPDITNLTARRLIWWEIQPWIDVMNEALRLEYTPVAFRPPYGIVTNALYDALLKFDMPLVLWSADLGDWSCTSDDCQDRMASRMRRMAENGAILLQHTNTISAEFVQTQLSILDELNLENVLLSQLLAELNEGDEDND